MYGDYMVVEMFQQGDWVDVIVGDLVQVDFQDDVFVEEVGEYFEFGDVVEFCFQFVCVVVVVDLYFYGCVDGGCFVEQMCGFFDLCDGFLVGWFCVWVDYGVYVEYFGCGEDFGW